jgi:ice-binding like protein
METSHFDRNRAERQRSRNAKTFRRIGARSIVAALVGIVMLLAFAGTDAYAADFVPTLGAASPYAVLEALPGTSAGLSSISGDLGLAAGSSVTTGASTSSGLLGTGLLSGVGNLAGSLLGGVTGITNVGNAAASSAEGAASTAYHAVASEAPTHAIAGSELDNVTLASGVYAAAGPLELAGRVILEARGVRNPDFVFQIPSNLRSAIGAQVILGAGVRPSDVLWQVGGATSLAPNTSWEGTILSDRSISLGAGVKLIGRAISLAGPVNLDRNDIALPLVSAAVGIAAPALSSPTSVVTPSRVGRTTKQVAAALPSLSIGAGLSLPVSLHLLSAPLVTVPKVPTTGSSATGSGTPAVGAPLALPFIPLGDIGVPEIAVPTLPATGIALPSVTAPSSPTTSGSGSPFGSTAVPSTGSSLPLSGLSLPGLTSPLSPISPSTSAPLSGLSLPSLTVPSVTTPSLSIPHLSTTPSTSTGQGSIARGRVKESAPAHSSPAAHAKSSTSPAASGSTIPSGAPQTGFGGMAGSTASRVLLSLLALLIAACASTFAVRSHRYQRG